jgi:hypothetical protein
MPLTGQASGGYYNSSSFLNIIHEGVNNTTGKLTTDSYTQTNPPVVATNVSTKTNTRQFGVLSGSVAFTRPDAGENFIGGPASAATLAALAANALHAISFRAVGVFLNDANGKAWENQPGVASGIGPYASSCGTYRNALYETALIGAATGGDPAAGNAIVYNAGMQLIASLNGYLMPRYQLNDASNAAVLIDDQTLAAESRVAAADGSSTIIGVLLMAPDAVQTELVYDQRI